MDREHPAGALVDGQALHQAPVCPWSRFMPSSGSQLEGDGAISVFSLAR